MNMFNSSTRTLRTRKMSVNDAQKVISGWRTDYKIMAEEPLMKYMTKDMKKDTKLKLKTKIGIAYNKLTYNYKVVRVKLGSEAYEVAL